ncbi:putative integral membrane protein [Aspergillus niger]|uniref:Glucanase n=1 Tax=Aspergillus niger TaxID=5061 RepID=A0A505IRP4_ASPNG|nr:putative integral membrane protein [Aspergillus niger]
MSSFQIYRAALLLSILATANAQQVGTYTTETHPSLTWQTCTSDGSCTTNDGEVVIDANWRWVHSTSSATNCYTGNEWDTSICTDDVTCAANCALDGATYEATYGVTTSGSELRLNFVTQGSSKNIGSRLYLMSDDSNYELFKLLGQEFTFDVDVSNLPCGLNGALYFVAMDADGGTSEYSGNKAGAKYGTGYCDSQCPRDLKFINGEANCDGWEPSSNNVNTGVGDHGSCCAEMDVWEANSISNAFTAHPCDSVSQTMCDGDSCGGTYSASGDRYSGTCDPDGCDYNPYRLGNTDFYGPGLTVDTNSPFTVVTQFITDDGTSSGTLTEIKRLYVQNGEVIANGASTYSSVNGSSITSAFCESEKTLDYPVNSSASTPGVARGTCSTDSGVPATVEAESPNAYVTYSNIKFGPIGSTYSSGSSSGSGSSSSSSSTTTKATSTTLKTTSTTSSGSSSTSAAQAYGQCGGQGWTGPTTCVSGYTCTYENAYYSQCL